MAPLEYVVRRNDNDACTAKIEDTFDAAAEASETTNNVTTSII